MGGLLLFIDTRGGSVPSSVYEDCLTEYYIDLSNPFSCSHFDSLLGEWAEGVRQQTSDSFPLWGQERSDGQFKPTGFLGVEFRRDLGEAGGDLLELDGIGEAAVHLGLKVGLLGGK